eukprot:1000123-Karenia_brevis.AAC.1
MQNEPTMTQLETPVSGSMSPYTKKLQQKTCDSARHPRNVRPEPQDAQYMRVAQDVHARSGLQIKTRNTRNTSHPDQPQNSSVWKSTSPMPKPGCTRHLRAPDVRAKSGLHRKTRKKYKNCMVRNGR